MVVIVYFLSSPFSSNYQNSMVSFFFRLTKTGKNDRSLYRWGSVRWAHVAATLLERKLALGINSLKKSKKYIWSMTSNVVKGNYHSSGQRLFSAELFRVSKTINLLIHHIIDFCVAIKGSHVFKKKRCLYFWPFIMVNGYQFKHIFKMTTGLANFLLFCVGLHLHLCIFECPSFFPWLFA